MADYRGEYNPNPERGDDRGADAPDERLSDEERAKRAALRLEEIHQYLSDRYARREVVARTRTPGGLELDWVPIESLTPDGKPADPPEEYRPVEPRGERVGRPVEFE